MEYLRFLKNKRVNFLTEEKKKDTTKLEYLYTLLKQIKPVTDDEIGIWLCDALQFAIELNNVRECERFARSINTYCSESKRIHAVIHKNLSPSVVALYKELNINVRIPVALSTETKLLEPPPIPNHHHHHHKTTKAKNTNNPLAKYIDKIIYINLEARPDRRLEIEREFKRLKIPTDKIERFPAIRHKMGAYGCTLSHISVLKRLISLSCKTDQALQGRARLSSKLDNNDADREKCYLILEDDFNFNKNVKVVRQALHLWFQSKEEKDYDVILFSTWLPYLKTVSVGNKNNNNAKWERVVEATTTSGYLVKNHYLPTLLQCFEESAPKLIATGQHWKYALDRYWYSLQKKDKWFVFMPLLGYQRPSKSNTGPNII